MSFLPYLHDEALSRSHIQTAQLEARHFSLNKSIESYIISKDEAALRRKWCLIYIICTSAGIVISHNPLCTVCRFVSMTGDQRLYVYFGVYHHRLMDLKVYRGLSVWNLKIRKRLNYTAGFNGWFKLITTPVLMTTLLLSHFSLISFQTWLVCVL